MYVVTSLGERFNGKRTIRNKELLLAWNMVMRRHHQEILSRVGSRSLIRFRYHEQQMEHHRKLCKDLIRQGARVEWQCLEEIEVIADRKRWECFDACGGDPDSRTLNFSVFWDRIAFSARALFRRSCRWSAGQGGDGAATR